MTPRRPILLAGPTACGKSALALRLARRDGGVVVNADASQVYGCWRILTARPGPEDVRRAEHALYGHVRCEERYSAGDWLRDLGPVLDRARRLDLRPIVVGGTGLYFEALVTGLAEMPAIPPEIRAGSEARLAAGDLAGMLADLARADPETLARIDRANPRRVQRAWEVLAASGRGLAAWQSGPRPALLPRQDCDCYVVEHDVAELRNRIENRFAGMIEDGAVDECRRYLASGRSRALPSARVLGASQIFAHLDGILSLEDACAAAVVATRRYAKRQRTWLRNRMADWPRLPRSGDPLDTISPG
jgi:tRNA dimethylallyltransferase